MIFWSVLAIGLKSASDSWKKREMEKRTLKRILTKTRELGIIKYKVLWKVQGPRKYRTSWETLDSISDHQEAVDRFEAKFKKKQDKMKAKQKKKMQGKWEAFKQARRERQKAAYTARTERMKELKRQKKENE